MKNKKYILGSTVAGLTFCAALAFNTFIFPSVLAAVPEKSEIKTVTAESVSSQTETQQSVKNLGSEPDANAISEKEAIDKALEIASKYDGTDHMGSKPEFKTTPYAVKYVNATSPANGPVWVVLFSSFEEDVEHVVPEDYADNAKTRGATIDEQGRTILKAGDITTYFAVDINALTGEYINYTVYSMGNDSEEKIRDVLYIEYDEVK